MRTLQSLRLLLVLLVGLTQLSLAEQPPALDDYLRYVTTESPATLETSVITLTSPKGESIDLVAVVHVAEAGYYDSFNKRFQGYDAVLYEMILPQEMVGERLPSSMSADSGVAGLQGMMARAMGLQAQIGSIDYSQENFVHADLTAEGLAVSMERRQESLFTYLQRAIMSSAEEDEDLGVSDQELAELDFMAILNGTPRASDQRTLRKLFAHSLASSGGFLSGMDDSAILASRNVAALRALDRELKKGGRKFALFYGAAHMPDIEAKLRRKGWTRTGSEWLKAWAI